MVIFFFNRNLNEQTRVATQLPEYENVSKMPSVRATTAETRQARITDGPNVTYENTEMNGAAETSPYEPLGETGRCQVETEVGNAHIYQGMTLPAHEYANQAADVNGRVEQYSRNVTDDDYEQVNA